ncbi:hypothetical protein MRB56_07295 [Halomonas cupida]|uniref:hypothetical protein n=1 Tax=Halomonas cupida TaxID=44933 RepID=UPI001161028F|nr:hypothetical protein [Halomonas cupida]
MSCNNQPRQQGLLAGLKCRSEGLVINPACFHVGLIAAQGRAAVGHQADARPHHTSRSAHLCQCGADDNQIDQDELFDYLVNNGSDAQALSSRTSILP